MTKENRLVWPRLWAIRSARLPKRSAGRSRRSRANSCATGCRAGATRRSTPPEPINNHGRSSTARTRASAAKSTPLSTITRRPHLNTISIRSGNDGKLLVEGALLISTGANVVASSPSKSRPSRASRHHVNNWLTDRLYRRAVAETCRRPAWLSATIRCFSANVQRRRAPVEITSRRETFELGVWSVIRLCLHPQRRITQDGTRRRKEPAAEICTGR